MKRLTAIFSILLTLALLPAAAQSDLQAILKRTAINPVSFDYSFTATGKVPVMGGGRVSVQGKMYRTEGGGLKIWCDSLTRWTLDTEAKEAYIEKVSDSPDILSDPVPYLGSLTDLKTNPDGTVTGIWKPQDQEFRFTISNIRQIPRRDGPDDFRFDTSTLGKDWVVTDLR